MVISMFVFILLSRADSLNVRLVGQCNTPGYAWDVFLSGSYAYVADYNRGLRVIDVSNPQAPYETGACDSALNAVGVMVMDSFAYVASHARGLRIVDIRDPAHPAIVSTFTILSGHGIFNLDVVDTIAYAISSIPCPTDQTLRVVNVADPAMPIQIDSIPAGDGTGQHLGLRLTGGYLYLNSVEEPKFLVFDAADPESVVQVGGCTLPSYPSFEIQTQGPYAYVTCMSTGLVVVDISDPTLPRVVGQLTLPSYSWGVDVNGQFAFVTTGNAGLRVVNIADPYHPVEVGFHDTPGYAQGVCYQAPYIYVVCDTAGLLIYELMETDAGESPVTAPVADVCLRSAIVTDAIELLGPGTDEFRVFDPLGRLLGKSRDRRFGCQDLAPGVYFVVLEPGVTAKVIKAR